MQTQVLITGGTGFVGQALLKSRLGEHFSIKIATREPAQCIRPNISVGTINRNTCWRDALSGVHTVVHLAAYAHVTQRFQLDSQALYETNVLGTQNLIEQCLTSGVKHLIFISSIGAVGSTSSIPVTEQSPCIPDTFYGKSKLEAEQRLIHLTQNTSLTYTILRPPLVYGSGNPGNMARLQSLIRRNLPLPLGAIANQRSFIYVENLVDAIIACIIHPNARNQIFHLSDGQDLSTPDLIRKIAHYSNHPCRLFPVPVPLLQATGYFGDLAELLLRRSLPLNREAIAKLTQSLPVDSRKIRQALDWHPPFTLDEGLARTFQSVKP